MEPIWRPLLKASLFLGVPSGSSVHALFVAFESSLSGGVAMTLAFLILYGGDKARIWLAKLTWP
jgi:hypothetical protein